MIRNNFLYTIAAVIMIVLAAAQGFILYRVLLLDAGDQYSEIPMLLGANVLLYAVLLLIYLRIFIGVNAYKKIADHHR